MLKKSLFKNNFKSINRTKRRFFSILIMAFLGVGFFSGLVATSPDMLDSLDRYADSSNLYDINILSTLGLTDDDIISIQGVEGVDKVYGTQSKDSLVKIDDQESICKVIEFNENINSPVVIAGRNIENENECLLDPAIVRTGEGAESFIGKKIFLKNEDMDSEDNPIFTVKEFEIVGIAETPVYISSERGNTTLGNGTVSFYIFTQDNVINMDYYTGLYVTVKGAKATVTNSDEYLKLVNSVIAKIENITETRENARYQSLVDDATKKINDAQKEFDDKKLEVDTELKDAESQIKKAEKQINSSEKQIEAAESELALHQKQATEQFEALANQIALAEQQLEESTIDPAIKEMQKQEIERQKVELERAKQESSAKFEEAQAEIASNKTEIRKGKNELSKNKEEFESKKQEAEDKLNEAQAKIDDAKEEINKIEKCKWYIQNRLDNSGYNNIFDAIKTMSNIARLFPAIFYLVAVLISLTSMTRMIEEERIEIGTLKALGYTNMQIISKYIIYSLLACIIGGVLGMTVGLYLLPTIVWSLYSMIYNMPHFYCTYRFGIGLIGIILAFICIGGATLLVARKELKQMPSVLMRPKPPKNGKKILLEKISFIWKRFNFSHKVTARNIFRYKKRAIMTVVGIAGCTGLMLTGFGIRDSVDDIPSAQFNGIFKYDTSITLSNTNGLSDIEEYLKNNESIENFVEVCATTGELSKESTSCNVTVFVPDSLDNYNSVYNLIDYQTEEAISISNEGIIITDKAAETLGVTVGDEITFIDGDDVQYQFKIENIAKNHVGHYVYMSKEIYENNFKPYKTDIVYLNTKNISDEAQNEILKNILNMDGVASVSSINALMQSVSDMLNTMNYVVLVLIVASAMLDFVVLYNLANINIAERQREIATLKVLGFHDNEVDNYINKENIIFTVLGIALGLILGTFLTSAIIGSIEIDVLKFMRNIKPISYVYSAVITLLFSFIVNFIIHFVLKKIDMIESLKSVE
ncbi:MAG: FtsX-like permease family protein [Clostridia bacterium]